MFFFASTGSKTFAAKKDDMVDMVILFLFLEAGKRDAALLLCSMRNQLKALLKSDTRSHVKLFVKVCRSLFCRPQMFTALTRDRLSSRTTQLVKFLIE